jgi:hypothetical protein
MKQQTLFEIYEEEHPSKKICSTCKQEKDVSEFHKDKNKKDGYHTQCKVCKREYAVNHPEFRKAWRENNKEHVNESRKEWRVKNKERERTHRKDYRDKNKEHFQKQARDYYGKNKIKLKSNTLKHKYNINENTRRQMYKDQGGCCAICGKPQSDVKTKLHIDHNHVTGVVRGLLCWNCNLTLGLVKDSPKILQKAIDYLNI